MELIEIVNRLIGKTSPLGESSEDKERLKNLETKIDLTIQLIDDIILEARNKGSHEYSVKEIGKKADFFINELRERLGQ